MGQRDTDDAKGKSYGNQFSKCPHCARKSPPESSRIAERHYSASLCVRGAGSRWSSRRKTGNDQAYNAQTLKGLIPSPLLSRFLHVTITLVVAWNHIRTQDKTLFGKNIID